MGEGGEQTTAAGSDIMVEVAYALPGQQVIIPVKVAPGATAEAAIRASGIRQRFPEIDLAQNRIGIFGKLIQPETTLRQQDRVEIYRPLAADPKETRRQRAAAEPLKKNKNR